MVTADTHVGRSTAGALSDGQKSTCICRPISRDYDRPYCCVPTPGYVRSTAGMVGKRGKRGKRTHTHARMHVARSPASSVAGGLFFFWFIHYSHATYQIMARLCTVRFLSAVRAVAARCKHPFCPPPRPVPRICDTHQGNYKRKKRRVSVEDKGKNEGKITEHRPAPKPFLRAP